MFAVESIRHSYLDGMCAKIVREHRRPRDRLQQRPMRAKHRYKRKYDKDFAEPDGHNPILVKIFTKSMEMLNRYMVESDLLTADATI